MVTSYYISRTSYSRNTSYSASYSSHNLRQLHSHSDGYTSANTATITATLRPQWQLRLRHVLLRQLRPYLYKLQYQLQRPQVQLHTLH